MKPLIAALSGAAVAAAAASAYLGRELLIAAAALYAASLVATARLRCGERRVEEVPRRGRRDMPGVIRERPIREPTEE